MKLFNKFYKVTLVVVLNLIFSVTGLLAQVRMVVPEKPVAETDDYTWWYVLIFVLIAGLSGAVFWHLKVKKVKREEEEVTKTKRKQLKDQEDSAVDFDSELEWYRKNKKIINRKHAGRIKKPVVEKVQSVSSEIEDNVKLDKKIAALEYSQLPISRFDRIELPRPYIPLPVSSDEALMSAIEQTHDEFEEDEVLRELAVRILARFKTKNSVEALSQVALYDLSSTLRSKAVGILSDFDHESVFETLLLACADPTREVKAASARGLFRLSFDRADCWMRIAESGDEFRIRHATRAIIAGDLFERSLVRLVHDDRKIAYEILALIVLLIKSGETDEVFNALENHPNPNVRKGILHVIKISKEHNALDGLYNLLEKGNLSEEMRQEIDSLVEEIGLVPA